MKMKKVLKLIYQLVPFKKQLYITLRKFFKVPQKLYQHLTFNGSFTVDVNESDSFKIYHYGFYIENELFWNGLYKGWEKESLKIWSQLCNNANCIFDVGANTGVYSLLAKSISKEAAIYAFEPIESIKDKLDKNISLNDFEIQTNLMAVSDTSGLVTIYNTLGDHSYSASVNKDFHNADVDLYEKSVPSMRLDDFIEDNGIKNIDLMKIDVEKHEAEVLLGMGEYLIKYKPSILLEILDQEIAEKIKPVIMQCGYRIFDICEQKGLTEVDDLINSSFRNILICKDSVVSELGL